VKMSGNKKHLSSRKAEAQQEAAASPAASDRGSGEPSAAAASTPPGDTSSSFGGVIDTVLSALNVSFTEPLPRSNDAANVGSPHRVETPPSASGVSDDKSGNASHWSKVRSALHIPASIQDGLTRASFDENEEL
jgi:hypothetical protein